MYVLSRSKKRSDNVYIKDDEIDTSLIRDGINSNDGFVCK